MTHAGLFRKIKWKKNSTTSTLPSLTRWSVTFWSCRRRCSNFLGSPDEPNLKLHLSIEGCFFIIIIMNLFWLFSSIFYEEVRREIGIFIRGEFIQSFQNQSPASDALHRPCECRMHGALALYLLINKDGALLSRRSEIKSCHSLEVEPRVSLREWRSFQVLWASSPLRQSSLSKKNQLNVLAFKLNCRLKSHVCLSRPHHQVVFLWLRGCRYRRTERRSRGADFQAVILCLYWQHGEKHNILGLQKWEMEMI